LYLTNLSRTERFAMIRIPCLLAATSLFLFSSVGCSSLSLPHFDESETAAVSAKPARCLCLWQPVHGADASGQPVSGFGGQVYFFAAGSEEPIEVDGDVRVFIFDDIGTPEQQARPKDVQDYDSFVWKSFLTNSQFGPNYTVFVPHSTASKYESICSLRLRLDQPDGSQLFSDMATIKLAGEQREDKSIRQLVSPREHSIRPDRSRELRVDLEQRHNTSDRATTIGSIKEGSLSLSNDDATDNDILDDHARLRIQRYESQLAEMHAEYERTNAPEHRDSTRSLRNEISDLMPAIRKVSHGSRQQRQTRQRVTPTAYEVFSTEDPQQVEHADFNEDRSQSSFWSDDRRSRLSRQTTESNSAGKIHSFSRPLNRRRESPRIPVRANNDPLQALQLARISE
jgi:hypothetical protein